MDEFERPNGSRKITFELMNVWLAVIIKFCSFISNLKPESKTLLLSCNDHAEHNDFLNISLVKTLPFGLDEAFLAIIIFSELNGTLYSDGNFQMCRVFLVCFRASKF